MGCGTAAADGSGSALGTDEVSGSGSGRSTPSRDGTRPAPPPLVSSIEKRVAGSDAGCPYSVARGGSGARTGAAGAAMGAGT